MIIESLSKELWSNWPNFKPVEFSCGCGKCSGSFGVSDMDENLMYILQFIRNKYARSMQITSGYRCQKYNDSLKGSIKNSDHIKKKAADFYIGGVTNTLEKRKEIIYLMRCMPNFKYAYCNGFILYADGTNKVYSADWMGSSIHVSVK